MWVGSAAEFQQGAVRENSLRRGVPWSLAQEQAATQQAKVRRGEWREVQEPGEWGVQGGEVDEVREAMASSREARGHQDLAFTLSRMGASGELGVGAVLSQDPGKC